MIRQEQWNIHEAVILLDGLLQYKANRISRAEAILSVSKQLRRMAENCGQKIDDVYRNTNGITFQMASMESSLAGYTIMKPASRLFSETVDIYRNEPRKYNDLLREAKAMINGRHKSNEEKFMIWLASKVTPAQLSELYVTYREIEEFCQKTKVLTTPLFETFDYAVARKVQQTIESNKVFRFTHRKSMGKYIVAITHFCKYLKELQETSENKPKAEAIMPARDDVHQTSPALASVSATTLPHSADSVTTENNTAQLDFSLPERVKCALKEICEQSAHGVTVSELQEKIPGASIADIRKVLYDSQWAVLVLGKWKYLRAESLPGDVVSESDENDRISISDSTSEPEVLTVSFDDIPLLAYTTPISFSYFDEETNDLQSWRDVYIKVFAALYEDYPHLLHVGASFTKNGDGRIDFGDESMVGKMAKPKPFSSQEGDRFYLETNLSANDLVKKLKFLLDLCAVDYENLVIKYSASKTTEKTETHLPSPATKSGNDAIEKDFIKWMLHGGAALATTRSYSGAIRFAEEYAKSNSFNHQLLYTEDHNLAAMTTGELFNDEGFIEHNRRQHNRFRAAITKLLEYYGIEYSFKRQQYTRVEVVEEPVVPEVAFDTTPFRTVLAKRFVRGFRIGSPLDMKKFRRYYEAEHEQELTLTDEEAEKAIRASGIQYNDKVFVPDVMIPEELREKLFCSIRESLAEGNAAVYYEALFRTFSEEFLDYYIYDADMLKAYIAFYNNGEFHLDNKYISKDSVTVANPLEEIKNILISAGHPIETEEICETLSHIPRQKTMWILAANSEFVHNGRSDGKGYYFHVSTLHLTDEDLENISVLIANAINEKTFVSGNELMEMISARYPHILENNPLISMMGMRDALKYHLGNKFSFRGNIISAPNSAISMADVFGNYARSHTSFTITELKNLASEMKATIYFDSVYDNSLRVSKNQFVSKEYAQFLVDDTDRAIARFCTGSFMPIGMIREFGTFPDAGYPWTTFLLEHFVYSYSRQFKLLHSGFNRECSVGAIVRRESGIESFNDLLSIALGESATPIKKDTALNFFVEQGYLARRNYSDIEKVLIQANTYRNRKGT